MSGIKRSPEQVAKIVSDMERTAYKKGWADAVAAMSISVGKMAAAIGVVKVEEQAGAAVVTKAKAKKVHRRKRPARSTKITPRQLVFDAIRENPGKTGSEIALFLASRVNKHTIRTQLRKLRIATEIEQDDEARWYAKGARRQAA